MRSPSIRVVFLILLTLPSACANMRGGVRTAAQPVVALEEQPGPPWRDIARAEHRTAIDDIESRWKAALATASRRYPSRIRHEGTLLAPEEALPQPTLTPGPYWCRLIRLGSNPPFVRTSASRCDVATSAAGQTLTRQGGPELWGGWLYGDDKSTRLIFLGAQKASADVAAPGYGADTKRDVAGVVERVAPFRWRLVLPDPEAKPGRLDIVELWPMLNAPPAS